MSHCQDCKRPNAECRCYEDLDKLMDATDPFHRMEPTARRMAKSIFGSLDALSEGVAQEETLAFRAGLHFSRAAVQKVLMDFGYRPPPQDTCRTAR